jgi:hypothetical protein
MRSENVSLAIWRKEIGHIAACVTGTVFSDIVVHLRTAYTQPTLINKGKGGLVNAMKGYWGRRGIAPHILNLVTRWR